MTARKSKKALPPVVYEPYFRKANASVYVATDGRGRHKIGFSAKPREREKQLQGRFGPGVSFVYVTDVIEKYAERVEIAAHYTLDRHHLINEWFDVSFDEAKAAVDLAIARIQSGDIPVDKSYEKANAPQLTVLMGGGSFLDGLDHLCSVRRIMEPGEDYASFIHTAVRNETRRRERAKPKSEDK